MAETALRAHRATLVLILGIIGLMCCMPVGIIAWVLGHQDLKDMNAGVMDPTGRGMTQAGKILGMISVILFVLGAILWFGLVAVGVLTAPAAFRNA